MARRGRQEFSVQEAVNMDSFGDWNYEVLDLNDDPEGESTLDSETSTYITSSNPAKKIVIYEVPGQAASFLLPRLEILRLFQFQEAHKVENPFLNFFKFR